MFIYAVSQNYSGPLKLFIITLRKLI